VYNTTAAANHFCPVGQRVLFRYQHVGYLIRTILSLCLRNHV